MKRKFTAVITALVMLIVTGAYGVTTSAAEARNSYVQGAIKVARVADCEIKITIETMTELGTAVGARDIVLQRPDGSKYTFPNCGPLYETYGQWVFYTTVPHGNYYLTCTHFTVVNGNVRMIEAKTDIFTV